jgi:hypothetical protein
MIEIVGAVVMLTLDARILVALMRSRVVLQKVDWLNLKHIV